MSKRKFKVGDEVFVKGWISNFADQKQLSIDVRFGFGRYAKFELNEGIVIHASEIKPVKKDGVVYEYRYLENVGGKEWWETVNYYTTKEECIKDMMVHKDCELQRITATKRVRK